MKRYQWFGIIVLFILALVVGLQLRSRRQPVTGAPSAAVSLPPNVTVQTVKGQTITVKDAPLVVKDPADQKLIASLLAETSRYKIQVQELTAAAGSLTSGGTLIPVPAPVHPDGDPQVITQEVPRPFDVEDYRLHVVSDGATKVTYTLHQSFLVLSVSGRDKNGGRVNDVKLFEQGSPEGNKEIPVKLNEVVVDDTVPHWLLGFNVQGGVAAVTGHATGYVAGLQWLVKGRSNNPKDLKWSVATPIGFFAPNAHELGLLPVSINVPNFVPHLPLTNMWVSPLITFAPGSTLQAGTIKRAGVALTVTF